MLRKLINLLAALTVTVSTGCASLSPFAGPEESSRTLYGEWTSSYREMERSRSNATPNSDQLGAAADQPITLVAILSDGTFDWSRTMLGVTEGIHGLRDAGDICVSRRDPDVRFRVDVARYTPALCVVELSRLHEDQQHMHISYPWMRLRLEIKLVDDGAVFSQSYPDGDSQNESIELHRKPRPHAQAPGANVSKIAGVWAESPDARESILIIRPDGTFDWTGTIEGSLGGFSEISHSGDATFNRTDPRQQTRLIRASYSSTDSGIELEWRAQSPDGEARCTIELHARAAVNDSIRVQYLAATGEIKRDVGVTLYRTSAAARAESVFGALAELSNRGPRSPGDPTRAREESLTSSP